MGEFDVFDGWGNFVGKFTPAGEGPEGCLFPIALFTVGLPLLAVFLPIYMGVKLAVLVVKITIDGFKALKGGDQQEAARLLAVPSLFLLVFFSVLVITGLH